VALFAASWLLVSAKQAAAERRRDLRDYVVKAVEKMMRDHPKQGYEHGTYFTHDLQYGSETVPASQHHPHTMCVAAVTEVIITALSMYADETKDTSIFKTIPARSWAKKSRNDLRPYLFMLPDVHSVGTADALEEFGIGEQVAFRDLLKGDFINFNREKTGHAVVFWGFINKNGDIEPTYDEKRVVGFEYFSAQNSTQGLAFKWAYFAPYCHKDPKKPADCGVTWSTRQRTLNSGYLLHPSEWHVAEANAERLHQALGARIAHHLGPSAKPSDLKKLSSKKIEELKILAQRDLEIESSEDDPPASYDEDGEEAGGT